MADILVVDDDADIAEALGDVLAIEGHVVRFARDGAEGLKRVAERLPDLVLLDVEMPVLDGPGMVLAMLLRDLGQENVPVVLLSGVPDLAAVAARVGTPYCLAKPYTYEALISLVDRALAERAPPRAGGSFRS